jgi:hypothetical protein
MLESRDASEEESRLLGRSQERLGRVLDSLAGLSDEDMRILRMSNKAYQAFRPSRAGEGAAQQNAQPQEETPEGEEQAPLLASQNGEVNPPAPGNQGNGEGGSNAAKGKAK